jgi:hypothetical protein
MLGDDLGCGDLGVYGQKRIATPNLSLRESTRTFAERKATMGAAKAAG